MSDYIHWVMRDKLMLTEREIRDYRYLWDVLSDIEYVWIHPMDQNRAEDGLELRQDFEYETGEYLDKTSGLMPKCTFFEMLAALSIRCENQLMRNVDAGDRTSKWFFEFLDNLGLTKYTVSKWKGHSGEEIRDIVEDEMSGRCIMFPLQKHVINQRNEQLWKQMTAYINENYINDGSNLALFRK